MKPAPDLFEQEAAALERALAARDDPALPAEQYRAALSDLVGHFERLMRESRRLIRRSDREERELNVLNDELHRLAAQLEYKARHDSLTGALNRGAIFERASLHLQRGELSLVVLDIDFFKSINDAFGHPAGDAVICEVVNRLRSATSAHAGPAEIGRVGGEEFSILLPRVDIDGAVRQAEAMRQAIAGRPFDCLPGRVVTASFGVSWTPGNGAFGDAYARADEALFEAKRGGRNQVRAGLADAH
ncbi:GGDEF domain-containing protein [Paucibacter sp. R3-3]|uniref:diguanylate cyclase n=1 Tax=Roseateles agri TaxID=3098619 RepID=A0ABU5DC99_9BURK|nr:GGDEF domain-containing protein [Paucibacter sp. R3-3]MDY0743908.1 GGDEF domain-containing protein [Paucibacter sp. R3-3]